MSDFSNSDYREPRSAPTVTRDKWIAHACNKMARGYTLIISPRKKNASFFKRGKGYDPCPYTTAKRLLEMNLVEQSGTHHLGTMYTLVSDALSNPPQNRPAPVEDDEDDGESDESFIAALESLDEDILQGDDDEEERNGDGESEEDREQT